MVVPPQLQWTPFDLVLGREKTQEEIDLEEATIEVDRMLNDAREGREYEAQVRPS